MANSVNFFFRYIVLGLVAALLIILLYPPLRNTVTDWSDRLFGASVEAPLSSQSTTDSAQTATATQLPGVVSYADAVAKAQNAVVMIRTSSEVIPNNRINPLGSSQADGTGAANNQGSVIISNGSGVIIDDQGHIVTNYHVIKTAKFVFVTLHDGRITSAKLVGSDPLTDLAVLQIEAENIDSLPLALESEPQVGDVVLAIGNPYHNYPRTVTQGIVSATQRSIWNNSIGQNTILQNFIQTDAPLDSGSSGGALINTRGELIGITTINASTRSPQAYLNFAIPADLASKVVSQIIDNGKVSYGWMGFQGAEMKQVRFWSRQNSIQPALRQKLADIAASVPLGIGVIIQSAEVSGPAEQAGLREFDVITHFEDQLITDSRQLHNLIANTAPDSTIKLTIIRDGQAIDIGVVLRERPTPPRAQASSAR